MLLQNENKIIKKTKPVEIPNFKPTEIPNLKPVKVITKTLPINIINNIYEYDVDSLTDQNNLDDNSSLYKLDFNIFDPSKFSPPNEWTTRLKNRIRSYNDELYMMNI